MSTNRYIHIITKEKITLIREYTDSDNQQYVEYIRDNPQMVELKKMYKFIKPKYVFDQSYNKL